MKIRSRQYWAIAMVCEGQEKLRGRNALRERIFDARKRLLWKRAPYHVNVIGAIPAKRSCPISLCPPLS
jgi:hypothetical protein